VSLNRTMLPALREFARGAAGVEEEPEVKEDAMAKCECCGEREATLSHEFTEEGLGLCLGVTRWCKCCDKLPDQEFARRIRLLRANTEPRDTIPVPSIAGVDIANGPYWSDIQLGGVKMPTVIGRTVSGEEVVGTPTRKRKWQGQDGFYVQNMLKPPDHSELAAEFEKAIRAAIEPDMEFVVDRDSDPVKTGVIKGTIRESLAGMIEINFDFTPRCRECSRPERPVVATHGELCVYCDRRSNHERPALTLREKLNEAGARRRNEEALAAEKPRSSKSSRELAKGHPSTWPSQDGEP